MTDQGRLLAEMKGVDRFLIELVGARYAPVLSLVLYPAFDNKTFDDPARLLDIFPNIPSWRRRTVWKTGIGAA